MPHQEIFMAPLPGDGSGVIPCSAVFHRDLGNTSSALSALNLTHTELIFHSALLLLWPRKARADESQQS